MKYLYRIIEKQINKVSAVFPAVLLTGPRQVGKTTVLKHLCKDERKYISLDDLSLRELANDDPKLFLSRFKAPLLIDEIQYAPNLLPYIKIEIDKSKKKGMYWLTGSQQFHLMKGINESLAGRIAVLQILGFSQREKFNVAINSKMFAPEKLQEPIKTKKNIFKIIWEGSFPGAVTTPKMDYSVYFNSYLQTYIQRDIRDLTQIGNTSQFLKFIKACAARTAQILNYSELAKDVDISVNTAKLWISILEASYQIFLLPAFSSNINSRLIKSPKLYFIDTGLAAHLTNWTTPENLSVGAMNSAFFETYVVSEILKNSWYHNKSAQLYYYRDKDKKEIDLIIEKNNTLFPVEIKMSAMVKKDWIKNFYILENFKQPKGKGAIICMNDEILPINNSVNAVPWQYL